MGSQTVTLVLTDLEGSTRLWIEHPALMTTVISRHHEIVHDAIALHRGRRPPDQGEGDAVFAAFDSATDAVAAVVRFQRELTAQVWPPGIRIRVRVGVHTGEVQTRDGNLFGSTVNRCARLRGLGAGGQVLLSAPTFELVRDRLPDGVTTVDLGEHRMKDLTRPERIHQLTVAGLAADFPPLASLDRAQHNLPMQTSSFLGREQEIAELVDLVTRERLVTILGFGGMGKTRLALQVAAELADGDGDGVWIVDLSATTDAGSVASLIAATLAVGEGADGPLPALAAAMGDRRLLLVLDNLEQLIPDIVPLVDQLLRAGPGLRLLATSREPLRMQGEHVYALPALPVPPPPRPGSTLTDAELSSLSAYTAVALFVARSVAARRDFTLTAANAAAVTGICTRLDGLPLAIELAAARTRALSPDALLPRLDRALKVLTGGSRNLPTRHQTLRATIGWSYDTLDSEQQRLLDRLAVFPASFTLEAAEAICGPPVTGGDDEIDVLDAVDALVDRSLLNHRPGGDGADRSEDRYSLLVSIREFASEGLVRAGEAPAMGARHSAHYAALVAFPPEFTMADRLRRRTTVRQEVPNLRVALTRAHDEGTAEEELGLALSTVWDLSEMGFTAEAQTVGARALARVPELTARRVHLLTSLTAIAGNTGRWNDGRRLAAQALAQARLVGDASLTLYAISTSAGLARSRADVRQLVGESVPLLAELPEKGSYFPRWFIRWVWEGNVNNIFFADPDQAEGAQRRQLAGAAEEDVQREQQMLGSIVLRRGRVAEAEQLLTAAEYHLGQAGPDWLSNIPAALDLAALQVFTGDPLAARQTLDRAEQQLREVDLPEFTSRLVYQRAVVDRIAGHPTAAVQRLHELLGSFTDDADPLLVGRMGWLTAVLHREAGDTAAAGRYLADAWAAVAGEEVQCLDLILECLLERAVQVEDDQPGLAVRLIGLVDHHRGDFVFLDGVTYDTDAMLTSLRLRVGDDLVDRILGTDAKQPLPDSAVLDSL